VLMERRPRYLVLMCAVCVCVSFDMDLEFCVLSYMHSPLHVGMFASLLTPTHMSLMADKEKRMWFKGF